MGGNGKHRWKFSFYHRSSTNSSSSPNHPNTQPPPEFLCPISGSLMFDPVVIPSGQSFDRVSIQVCRDLGFTPTLPDGSTPDFSTTIPNLAIKTTILTWCRDHHTHDPSPLDYTSVEKIVRSKIQHPLSSAPDIRVSELELLKAVAENPPVLFSHAATEIGPRINNNLFCSTSSSSDESVIVTANSPHTPLPLTTRPACFSASDSSSSSIESESLNPNSQSSASPEEQELFSKLKSPDIYDQETGLVSLRKLTRTNEEARVSLCSPRILSALRPLIISRYNVVQTNAIASLVNLSLEKPNKVMIVRSGFVPLLIDVLKAGSSEAQEHAAGALFSLALEDENKMAIGVLGALQPLLHALRSDSERTQHDSALALYHLSLIQSNRVKLVKLGAVSTLLSMVKSGESASRVLLVLCNLAASTEGKSAMLDANAVAILVGMLRESELVSEASRENCVAALFALSQGSMRFKGLAKEARAVELWRRVDSVGLGTEWVETFTEAKSKMQKIRKRKQQQQGGDGEAEHAHSKSKISSEGVDQEPYPSYHRPTPEECRAVRDDLLALHGFPPQFLKYRHQRHHHNDHAQQETVLDGLVKTVLSQNTTELNSLNAFASLKSAFPSWDQVLAAESTSLENAIRCGGLAPKKASCIKNVLKCLHERNGKLCLEYLRDLSIDEMKTELSNFKGVGPKTVACVLIFNLQQDDFPVDTHVFEIARTIGWVPSIADRNKTYLHLNRRIPNELKFDLNCLLYTHDTYCVYREACRYFWDITGLEVSAVLASILTTF
ncbi:Armadillo [Corchorus olitorius]|uniref:RING-type E3 ubiquitin transferase n=1 Tax=Corchorus olitorius TaxID=93759 RepID=A0A1R3KUL8_9ROSI|nr:Armadillo [Corchorus olitorius]